MAITIFRKTMEILAAGSNIVFARFMYGFSVSCLPKLSCMLFLVNETANFATEAQRQMTDRQRIVKRDFIPDNGSKWNEFGDLSVAHAKSCRRIDHSRLFVLPRKPRYDYQLFYILVQVSNKSKCSAFPSL